MSGPDGQKPATQPQPAATGSRSMAVLYGTETGNAEEIAMELGDMASRLHFQTTVDEMDSFKLADVLRASLVIFVTSTTGQGEMPKNTLKFWKNLRREKLNNTNCLASVRFTIFGLGDSSYLKFNWAARKLRARLLQLGATEFFRAGEGDERHDDGIDSIYLPWLKDLKATLLANYPLPESVSPIPDDIQLPPKYSLRLLPSITMNSIHDGNTDPSSLTDDERRFLAIRTKSAARSHILHPMPAAEQAAQDLERLRAMFPAHYARADAGWERENGPVDRLDKDNILKDQPEMYLLERETTQTSDCPPLEVLPIPDTLLGKLLQNRRVTPAEHWQDVRYLSFEIILGPKELDIAFQLSGNLTLTIFPKNYPQDVEEIIRLMDWDAVADRLFSVDHGPRGLYVEDRVTSIRELLTHHLDFTAIPKRSFIKELAYYTNEEREIERLRELTMPGNEQEFYDYTSRPRRTILEVLRDFPGVKIPHERILDIFPLIRGREYSVCNGGIDIKATENEGTFRVDILAALVEYKTIIRKPRQGSAPATLNTSPTGAMLRVGLKLSSGQSLVPDKSAASRPMVAIATGTGIAPIRAIIQEREIYGCQGDTLLFFGCRNRSADFYFEHEWENYPSVKVYPAFLETTSSQTLPPPPSVPTPKPTPLTPAPGLATASA